MIRFSSGLLAGGLITAIGVGFAMNDRRTRRKIMRNGRRMAARASHFMDDLNGNIF